MTTKTRFLRVVEALAVAVALSVCAGAQAAWADEVRVTAPDEVRLGFVDVAALDIACDPDVISVGVSCGMDEMCGLDPCLCGAADAWGACACNGLQDARPSVAVESSDEQVVSAVELAGRHVLVARGAGEATVRVRAELPHFDEGIREVKVTVAPFGPADALKAAVPLAALAAIAALVARAARRKR